MNLHEYQGRVLFKAAGIPMPDGDVASSPSEVEAIAKRLGGTVVVKAQVHAGGRGKAGGVKLAKTPAEAAEAADFELPAAAAELDADTEASPESQQQ
jgi:succinyl-CoA synthetase beta subunit